LKLESRNLGEIKIEIGNWKLEIGKNSAKA
jgi:hypothetical protein